MTPELKEKLLRYANEKEPFTAHNHIRVCDIDEGSSRLELDLTEQTCKVGCLTFPTFSEPTL